MKSAGLFGATIVAEDMVSLDTAGLDLNYKLQLQSSITTIVVVVADKTIWYYPKILVV